MTQVVHEDLAAELAALKRENDALKARIAKAATQRLRCKISEKGALSVYGMGQWPVTLYKSQWTALIAYIPEIKQFLLDHDAGLADKAK